MKKIILGLASVAMAASLFAVDFSSKVKMDAVIANKNGDDVEFFTVKNKDQKDDDALIFSASGEKAGATFKFWYNYDGSDTAKVDATSTSDSASASTSTASGTDVPNLVITTTTTTTTTTKTDIKTSGLINVRHVSLWFKPIDALKITVGNVSVDSYKEQIFWWHGVYGEIPGTWGAFGGEYVTGAGVKSELNPIDGLELTFAFMPGIDTPWISTNKDAQVKSFATKAKYSNIAGLPLSAAAVFAYQNEALKIIGIGADYSSNGFYGFLNANINLNKDGLTAISFDNFEKYSNGPLTVAGHFPISLYKAGDDMKVGMHATVKVSYGINGFTPYLLVSNERDGDAGWKFDDFKFDLTIQPGVGFNVGACGFDVYGRVDIKDGKLASWSVPVEMGISL